MVWPTAVAVAASELKPPSEVSTWPTTQLPADVASHAMSSAGSSGLPTRPNGVVAIQSSRSSSDRSVVSGSRYPVFTGPGLIVFRTMPSSRSSCATVAVTPASAALLAA